VHDFAVPQNVKFGMVNGNREAFRPGTEPKPYVPNPGAALPVGGEVPGPYGGSTPAGAPPAAPPKKPPADLNGLY